MMNRGIAFSTVFAAAVAAGVVGRAQGQTLTLYQGPGYSTATTSGYHNPSIQTLPGMTAGNGVGVGQSLYYSGGTYSGVTQGFLLNTSGTPVQLQPIAVNSASHSSSTPYAVNASGITVGYSTQYNGSGTGPAPVVWNVSGGVTALQTLGTDSNGNPYGYAVAINANGTAAGYDGAVIGSFGSVPQQYATTWNTSTAAITKLAVFSTSTAGNFSASGLAINSAGSVVGTASVYNGTAVGGSAPVLWTAGTNTAKALGTLGTTTAGFTAGTAYAINDLGFSAGSEAVYNSAGTKLGTAPTRWDASGNVTQLGTLGVASTNNQFTGQANAINLIGTIVGTSAEYTGAGASVGTRAAVWAAGSSAVNELPNLGLSTAGSTSSDAYSINDDGLAVGYATDYSSNGTSLGNHATLWVPSSSTPSGYSVIDLNSLLNPTDASEYVVTSADSISNTDWVTAIETNLQTTYTQEVLFNVAAEDPAAVPEPASLLTLLASATAVLLLGRPRRQQA
jgi:hypothetical protein